MAVGSFSSALSGLNANGVALGVIGNNLANINTVGFKASSVSFQDLVSQNVGGTSVNPMQVGLGVSTGSISPNFGQGSIQNTGEALNAAIQGQGFFVVKGDALTGYTRAGNFTQDNAGTLITTDGFRVQGYTAVDPTTGEIITSGTPADIVIPNGALRPAVATTTFQTLTNLSSDPKTAPINSTYSAVVSMYDPRGTVHELTITYTKVDNNNWSYQLTLPGEDVEGGTAGTPYNIPAGDGGSGTFTFDGTGALTGVNGGAVADIAVTSPAWSNGATANAMTWQILDSTGASTITGYSSNSDTPSKSQNGKEAGNQGEVSITSDGSIQTKVNGQTVTIAKLAIATFNNPKGLVKQGQNLYAASQAAGMPNVGAAGQAGRGTLIGSALEQSNVDMAQEFTNMILSQRGYQANSKSITTADEMLQEALNLKR